MSGALAPLVLIAALVFPFASEALLIGSATAFADDGLARIQDDETIPDGAAGPVAVSAAVSVPAGAGVAMDASAQLALDYGVLHFTTEAVLSGTPDPERRQVASGGLSALLRDTLTIGDPLLAGTAGSAVLRLHLSGDVAGDVEPGVMSLLAWFRVSLASDGVSAVRSVFHSYDYDVDDVEPPVAIDEFLEVAVPFTFGAAFPVEISLLSQSTVRIDTFPLAPTAGSALVDFGSTVRWAGIAQVRDASGALVADADWSVSSESGTDYRGAIVPEPSAAALVALGVALLGARGFVS